MRHKAFYFLAYLRVIEIPCHVTENIGGNEYIVKGKPPFSFREESRNGLNPVLLGIRHRKAEAILVREAHVVELYLVESVPGRFNGYIDVIVPHLFFERIDPYEILPVPPYAPVLRPDSPVGFRGAEGVVFKNNYPRDCVYAFFFKGFYESLYILYYNRLLRANLGSEWN